MDGAQDDVPSSVARRPTALLETASLLTGHRHRIADREDPTTASVRRVLVTTHAGRRRRMRAVPPGPPG